MAIRGTCRSSGPLQGRDSEFGGCPATQGALLASGVSLLRTLASRTPAHLGTLDPGTFEVQNEALAKARVWGSRRSLELQREVGPRGEEAAERLRSPQLGQDSGAGTVPIK